MLPNKTIKNTEELKERSVFHFSRSESAAVTALIAILLLGLVFTAVAIVKLEYVPEWKIEAEQDNIHNIWDDMVEIKTRIDILFSLMKSSSYPTGNYLATLPFNTGGGEIPVFEPSESDGKLEVNTERCAMTIIPHNSSNEIINKYTLECGGITYYSQNKQYPEQIFRYENGALILANGKSSIMKQYPIINIEKTKDNESCYNVTINGVQLIGKPDSISSNTVIPLQLTEFGTKYIPIHNSNGYISTDIKNFNLIVATKYPDAWFEYFNQVAQNKRLVPDTDYKVEYLPDSGSVSFSFLPNSTKTLEVLDINKAIIRADIVPLRYQNVMKLNKWYFFNTVSGTGIDLSCLRDCDPTVVIPIENSDGPLSEYSNGNIFTHDLKKDSLESTFGFSGFTEFESQPNSVTILMIYHPRFNNPQYQDMSVSGTPLPKLTGNNKENWYLYKQTIPTSASDPSKLKYHIKIDLQNGEIDIDYLAVSLS